MGTLNQSEDPDQINEQGGVKDSTTIDILAKVKSPSKRNGGNTPAKNLKNALRRLKEEDP
jgi:hypothetical protein